MSLNTKVLPPKLFQDPYHPYYDPIRHENWLPRAIRRVQRTKRLQIAYRDRNALKAKLGHLAEVYDVDERQLRDYFKWRDTVEQHGLWFFNRNWQAILDGAYEMYCGQKQPFLGCIRRVAALFGERARPIVDLWETHPFFYPTGYPKPDTDL